MFGAPAGGHRFVGGRWCHVRFQDAFQSSENFESSDFQSSHFLSWFALDRALKWSQIHQNQFLECSRRSFCHLGHLFIFTTAFFLRFSATSLVASEERNYDTANCVRTSRSPAKSKCMRAYSILFLPRLTQAQGDYLYDGRSKS